MDWFKSYPADYRDDTWHLTLSEHGAYKLLIDHYMHHEKPLPDNENALASIVGVDPQIWSSVSVNVRQFFTPKKGKLIHKRCEEELNCSFEKRKDGKKRASKYRKSLNTVTRDECVSNAPRGEERREEESIEKEDTNVSPKKPKNGTRISEDWALTQKDIEYANKKGNTHDQLQALSEGFYDHWIQAAGKGSTSLDWNAKWRTWVNQDIKFNGEPTSRINGSGTGGKRNVSNQAPTSRAAAHREAIAEMEIKQGMRQDRSGTD